MSILRYSLVLLPLALLACQTVPITGRHQVLLMSTGEECKLGTDSYQDTMKKSKLSTDQAKIDLIRKVGQRIAKAADKPDFQWEFNLVEDDKQINAWCLPGGKVAFYTGILPVTRDEGGIAVVMSHEVAHALARHGAERMSQGMIVNLGGQALSVALKNKPAQTQEIFGQAYGLGVNMGVMLPYSRSHESEADHIGLVLMAKAGYDPAQAVDFWKRMEAATGGGGASGLAAYMSTHPANVKRVQQIQEWLPEVKAQYYRP